VSVRSWKIVASVGGVSILLFNAGCASQTASDKTTTVTEKATSNEVGTPVKPPAPTKPALTAGQENALQSAKDYLDGGSFSRAGLISQLSSSAGEGYTKAEATYATDHAGANWNAEAVESAKAYLEYDSFSRSGLIEQLTSSSGEGYTQAQASYAVSKVY